MKARRGTGTIRLVLEDRRVDEVLERSIGLERLVVDVQAQLARLERRVGDLEAAGRREAAAAAGREALEGSRGPTFTPMPGPTPAELAAAAADKIMGTEPVPPAKRRGRKP